MSCFPKEITLAKVPPLKIQGIKTKLIPFIARSIKWDGNGTYFEPFMGSGLVGFNLAPKRAIFSDTNPYIIRFYQDLQNGIINSKIVGEYLADEGTKLSTTPADKQSYYYDVRQRFNQSPNSLDFLFLQRANFNGMMRFNASGEYNVPFGRKPQRFQPALITKIRNQVNWVENLLANHDWTFVCQSFDKTFKDIKEGDFVYLDPPYINRYDGYYDNWSQELASRLAELTKQTKAGFAFSMWLENQYRRNPHIDEWDFGEILSTEHFYHLGGKETNRNSMTEALIIHPDCVAHY